MTKPNGVHAVTTAPLPGAPDAGDARRSDVGTEAMANALNAQAARLADHDRFMRDLARAIGMSPADAPAAIVARVREEHAELTALRPAVAAFYAAAKGLPSYIAVRPVCKAPLCDCLPRTNGLCNKHYKGG